MFKERGGSAETKTELKNAIDALNNFYLKKAAQNDQFASLNAVGTMTLQDVMKIIPEDVSLVEYYYDSNNIYIWAFDNKRYHFVKKNLKAQNSSISHRYSEI